MTPFLISLALVLAVAAALAWRLTRRRRRRHEQVRWSAWARRRAERRGWVAPRGPVVNDDRGIKA